MKLTGKWTPEERIAVATEILRHMMVDIPAGRYSEPGRPNCTSAIGILNMPAEELADSVEDSQKLLDRDLSSQQAQVGVRRIRRH